MKSLSYYIKYIVVMLLLALAMICIVSQKQAYHLDEVLSFQLSNNKNGGFIYEEGKVYAAKEFYNAQLSVPENAGFDYKTVWENQKKDVHPPLYYFFVHTVCSFFEGRTSKWYSATVNLMFYVMCFWTVKGILDLITEAGKNKNIISRNDIAALIFAFMPGTLDNVSFLRMYVAAEFAVLFATYSVLLIIRDTICLEHDVGASSKENDSITKLCNIKTIRWVTMGIAMVVSALTHYYCVMYLFFLEVVMLIFFVIKRKKTQIVSQIVVAIIAAIITIAIFPAMLGHVFSGYRGVEVQNNFVQIDFAGYVEHLRTFFLFYYDSMGGLINLFVIAAAILLIVTGKGNYEVDNNEKGIRLSKGMDSNIFTWVMVIPAVLYFAILCKITIYDDPRYLFPIYGVVYIIVCKIVLQFADRFCKKNVGKQIILLLVGILAVFISYYNMQFHYLYKDIGDMTAMLQQKNAIVADSWGNSYLPNMYNEIIQNENIVIYRDDNIGKIQNVPFNTDSEIILYTDSEEKAKMIGELINPGADIQLLWNHDLHKVFRFSQK